MEFEPKRDFFSRIVKQALRDKRVILFGGKEQKCIPKDVPKGHLAVYVGEECKRFVINVSFLKHPLFQPLLDHVEQVFQFSNGPRFRIPCDECVFVHVLRCIGRERDLKFPCCL